jgi:multicomponent Na+:H+ antiporter subunit F
MNPESTFLTVYFDIALGVIALAVLLAFIHVVRGPSLPDRIMGLDLVASLSLAFIVVYAMATGQSRYIDIVAVVVLIIFIATVAYAMHLKKRPDND